MIHEKPMTPPRRPMLVVVHDFTPVFARELKSIIETLHPILGNQFSVAIVPRWHGASSPRGGNQHDARGFRELLALAEERLLHGWTHQSQSRLRPISLLTGRADEFRGLASPIILDRLRTAQAEFEELTGEPAQGLVPPAWQLPVFSNDLAAFRFVMRFRKLECCRLPNHVFPLVTCSWDWGRLGWLSRGGECIGSLLRYHDRNAIPCIAIHPADQRRGLVPHAVKLIRQLIEIGHTPTTATQVISSSPFVVDGDSL